MFQLKSKGRLEVKFPLPQGNQSFPLKAFNWLDEAHPYRGENLFCSKSTDLNINLFFKKTFTAISRLVFDQISGYRGLANFS